MLQSSWKTEHVPTEWLTSLCVNGYSSYDLCMVIHSGFICDGSQTGNSCATNRNVWINYVIAMPVRADELVTYAATWVNLKGNLPCGLATAISFTSPFPQRALLHDSIHETFWKMKLSPWWHSWVSGSEGKLGHKGGTWAFWGQVNYLLFLQWWWAHNDYTESSPRGSLHRCASRHISVIHEDCRKTAKGYHLYFAKSVNMVVMRMNLSQHCSLRAGA